MTEHTIIDCRQKTCGLIPQMQMTLKSTDRDRVEFLVRAHIVPQVVNALGIEVAWDMEVVEEGESALVRFTRRQESDDSLLNII